MRARRLTTGFVFVMAMLTLVGGPACSSSPAPGAGTQAPAAPPVLQPREAFDWTGEKISFSMPPTGWRREGETSGGIKGVRFVKERSVGEGIGLGDYYILADRNRSTYLRDMLAKFDTYDDGFAWDRDLRNTYAYTDTPFSPLESEIAERVNTEVGQASMAYRNRDRDGAKEHLQEALAAAERLHFSLAEVIDRVEFKPERKQNPEYYQMLGRRETTIAGEPGVVVDYTVKVPERLQVYSAREAYFVHNSHLFVCTFIGLKETLAVFDAILASIEFEGTNREVAAVPKEPEVGSYRAQASAPAGWELLDQGAQKRFRKGESEIVLQNLGQATRTVAPGETEPIRDLYQLADWGLATLTPLRNDDRREVKSRRRIVVDGHEAMDIETWNRLDHTWPQRLLFVRAGDDLFALHTTRPASVGERSRRSATNFISPRAHSGRSGNSGAE